MAIGSSIANAIGNMNWGKVTKRALIGAGIGAGIGGINEAANGGSFISGALGGAVTGGLIGGIGGGAWDAIKNRKTITGDLNAGLAFRNDKFKGYVRRDKGYVGNIFGGQVTRNMDWGNLAAKSATGAAIGGVVGGVRSAAEGEGFGSGFVGGAMVGGLGGAAVGYAGGYARVIAKKTGISNYTGGVKQASEVWSKQLKAIANNNATVRKTSGIFGHRG